MMSIHKYSERSSSILEAVSNKWVNFADLAQSVERAPFKRVVVGSIPTVGIICSNTSIPKFGQRGSVQVGVQKMLREFKSHCW
jgi:hypothetical protein